MKNQNQNSKLAFNKVAVVELNENQMHNVDGGSSPICLGIFIGYTISIVVNE